MLHRPRRFQVLRVLTLLVVLAVSGACATWRPQAGPAAQAQPSGRVRLTLDDGSVVVLDRAVVSADSVRGEPRAGERASRSPARACGGWRCSGPTLSPRPRW